MDIKNNIIIYGQWKIRLLKINYGFTHLCYTIMKKHTAKKGLTVLLKVHVYQKSIIL